MSAEILVKMGAISMTFTGTVEIAEQDMAAHRAVPAVKPRETGGQGHANASVEFKLADGGGKIHTSAQLTGKAASMGEGVVAVMLDTLIKDFTEKLGEIRATASVRIGPHATEHAAESRQWQPLR